MSTPHQHNEFLSGAVVAKNSMLNLFGRPAKFPTPCVVFDRITDARWPGIHLCDSIKEQVEGRSPSLRQSTTPIIYGLTASPRAELSESPYIHTLSHFYYTFQRFLLDVI